jgi:hypothetical protein
MLLLERRRVARVTWPLEQAFQKGGFYLEGYAIHGAPPPHLKASRVGNVGVEVRPKLELEVV